MGGWVRGMRFFVFFFVFFFNNIPVISGRWTGDNEKSCAMEPRLRLERSPPRAGIEPRISPSIDQGLGY